MPQITIQQNFEQALQNHQQGRLTQAETNYRQVLARHPNHVEALLYLGLLAGQTGRSKLAVDLLRRTITLRPDSPQAHANLGNALRDDKQPDAAITSYRQAIGLLPDFPEAYYNLGNVLLENGRLVEAIAAYQQVIAINPHHSAAHNNLGNALQATGQFDLAIAAYRQVIALEPASPEALNNLGVVLKSAGQTDDAIAAYHQAIALAPRLANAHFNLGNALHDKGLPDQAIIAYCKAIDLQPNSAKARFNLANTLFDKGNLDQAIAAYRQALVVDPMMPQAHCNLGNALADAGQLDEALAAYRQAIACEPSGSMDSNWLYALQFHPHCDAKTIAEELHSWNRRFAEPLRCHIQAHTNDRTPGRRLRIGYVSPDFRDHCQSFFTLPLLAHHHRQSCKIFCYADVPRPDELTARIRDCTDAWRNITGLTDARVADIIRDDQIDILVDLTMHMSNNRLGVFARKPAPVQVTWLAYPGSTGLGTMDYRLSDPSLDPPDSGCGTHNSEAIVRLPESFWCYDPLSALPAVGPLPALSVGYITFGSLNNYRKVNRSVLELWSKVLLAVKDSRLILLSKQGTHRQHALDVFEHCGVSSNRIDWFTPAPRADYLTAYQKIDISLDTFPYNGHTTSLDSFWMGVPVITLVGQTVVGRGGLSQAMNLGLPELIAHTPEQYVKRALNLASDIPLLATIRKSLRPRMQTSPLMDAPRFATNIEAAYRSMWHLWCLEKKEN